MTEAVITLEESSEETKPFHLPRLREDLSVFPSARTASGEKSWVLHDPLRNRYFHIGEREIVLLGLWDTAGEAGRLVELARREAADVDLPDVIGFAEFLVRCELVQPSQGGVERFSAMSKDRHQTWWEKLLHGYLFFKVPLIRPDALLLRLYPHIRPLLSRRFAILTAVVGLVSLFFVARQWDIFITTFMAFLNWEGAAAFGLAIAIVKILHEAGHAIACRHFGLRVPSIGVAFIVMWPVMYTDASEAWRLTSRRSRLVIACAGMMVELSIACYATLLWVLLPDGIMRSVMFTLATTTWITSLAVNLNPLMRFDGYFIFSDLFNIPNLQERAFALARSRMRHILFGTPLSRDPGLPAREQYIALGWAYATWVYRFFLFLGIAFLVYHFFFKLLGILLFLVEIWWFLVGPIWREVKNWRELSTDMGQWRKHVWIAGLVISGLLLLIPWQPSFRVPALMRAAQIQHLYPAESARVVGVHVRSGQKVNAGAPLIDLQSPELDADIAAANTAVQRADFELNRVLSSVTTAGDRLVAEEARSRARASLDALSGRRQKLHLLAPFSGTLMDIPAFIRAGLWVGAKKPLGVLVGGEGGMVVDAYVSEDYLRFVRKGGVVKFYPEDVTVPVQQGRVEEIDPMDTVVLAEPYLAQIFGGGIAVRMTDEGMVPEHAVYRVRVRLSGEAGEYPMRVVRGWARLDGDSRSLIQRGGSFLVGVLLRESGF